MYYLWLRDCMTDTPNTCPRPSPEEGTEQPGRHAATFSLAEKLRARKLTVDWWGSDLLVAADPPAGAPLVVKARPRPSDGDRLWFWVDDVPVAEADHVEAPARVADRVVSSSG